jgi:hypothetical protein
VRWGDPRFVALAMIATGYGGKDDGEHGCLWEEMGGRF